MLYDRNEIGLLILAGLCGVVTTVSVAVTVTAGGGIAAIGPIIAVASAIIVGYLLGERRAELRPFEEMQDQIAQLQQATQQHIEIHRAMRFQPEDLHTQIANIQAGIAMIQRALAMVLTRAYPADSDVIHRELGQNGRT